MSSITVWNLGRVSIFPHIEFKKLYTFEEIQDITKKIQNDFEDKFQVLIYPKNTYCCEMNGYWNVIIGFKKTIKKGNKKDSYIYTYVIRRDSELGKSYGCPILNKEYIFDRIIRENSFDNRNCPEEFKIFEDYLKKEYSGKEINSFPV